MGMFVAPAGSSASRLSVGEKDRKARQRDGSLDTFPKCTPWLRKELWANKGEGLKISEGVMELNYLHKLIILLILCCLS